MIIALDYDGTYTRDPDLWIDFINKAYKNNHQVILATMRYENEQEDMCKILLSKVKVIFTGRKAKREFLQNLGIEPHIWIDDIPDFIVSDFKLNKETVS